MVRLICNQLKSKTSHYFRLYRRPEQKLDDNSHNIIAIANDIGQGHELADGYVLDSISNKLTHIDDYETTMDNEMVMSEVNNFINNNLTFYEKEIYKMYYEEELSHVKISKATRIPATSIGNTVRKVLAMIQSHLESVGIFQDNEDDN
jgi:DNA-directed RNA polymerase specialized sigma subunit